MGSVCELREVGYTYPGAKTPALAGISLRIAPGAWVALLGSNGSGKSTLARIFNALLVPTQGSSLVCGWDTGKEEHHAAVRREVCMVFQNPENQIVAATVEEDVAFGPENLGLPSEEIVSRVRWALEVVGLTALGRQPVYALSGGQKQRLAVAGALALRPRCLVLDEATSMLDPQGRADLASVLRELHAEGMTLVSITHRLEEILDCDEVHVLHRGQQVWHGAPLDFFAVPRPEWGVEDPPLWRLWRRLRSGNRIPRTIFPRGKEMAEALCPSR